MRTSEVLRSRERAQDMATGSAIACEVTAIHLSPEGGDPLVDVRPLQKTRIVELSGNIEQLEPLDIIEVPYAGLIASSSFALWIPPELGMQGLLINTQYEVGELASGERQTTRVKDKSGGYFQPTGMVSGAGFQGSEAWAEIRSEDCRIAVSESTVHLEAGDANMVLEDGKWDINVAGLSLLEALQEMSSHLERLEKLVHKDGTKHGPVQDRKIDDMAKATPPEREERGVR